MTFSSTVEKRSQTGSFQMTVGTFNADGVVTGNIDTGMGYIYMLSLEQKGSSVATYPSGIFFDETIPGAVGHAVTIHCAENISGVFIAIGR